MPTPAAVLHEALVELRATMKEHAEVAVNTFEDRTALSVSQITIYFHELSALPHPLYAVKAVDVELVTE